MYGTDIGTLAVDVLSGGSWIYNVWTISGQQQTSNSASYATADVDLSAYSVSQVRFRAIAAGGYRGDIAIDNVELWSISTGPVAPEFLNDPVVKSEAHQDQAYSDSIATDADDANGDPIIFSKVSGPAWLNIATDGELSGTPDGSDVGLNSFQVEISDGLLASTGTIEIYVNDNSIPILLFEDDFESDFGNWSNVTTGDNKNWTRDYGGTPSSSTGPSSGAGGSTYYMYLETSYGSAYTAGDTAILLGPAITDTNIHITFEYHMYGTDTGTLSIDVLSGGSWINDVWSISGQQQTSYSDAYTAVDVDLRDYTVDQIRFRATAAGGYMGDIAIDNVNINYHYNSDDLDGDGVPNDVDLCPDTPSDEIADADGCSPSQVDSDNDGVLDINDAFPQDPTEWSDADADGIGDNADTDDDNDGVDDANDAFPLDPSESVDTDGDLIGNNADIDDDNDGVADVDDAYPLISLGGLTDTDGDGIPDECDQTCLGLGMTADDDDDNDGVDDAEDAFPLDPSESVDTDGDLIGNNADTDDDGDGVLDVNDLYPLISLGGLLDTDGNGMPNECDSACVALGMSADPDDDGDGVNDLDDTFPLDASESGDNDGDGTGDNADMDDDNDGIPDAFENIHACLDPFVDDASDDYDGDGSSNQDEYSAGTNPCGVEVFAYSVSSLGYVYEINLYDGETTYVGSVKTGENYIKAAIAFSPEGVLYVVDSYSDGDALYTVNLVTGQSKLVAGLSLDVDRIGLCFDDQGTLWMVSDNARLYTIKIQTGSVTYKGTHGVANIDSLAWDGNTLYGIASSSQNELYTLDRSTAAATLVGSLVNLDITGTSGMTFQANGELWGIETYGNIFTVDKQTGEATIVSSFNPSGKTFYSLAMIFDTDADGIPDGWEDLYGLDKLDHADAMLDGDNDNLTNIEEYYQGSNPSLADTDADGVNDNIDEFPTDNTEWLDTDGDLIGNNADTNDDNDLFLDTDDPFPLDSSKPQYVKVTLHDIPGVSDTSMFAISVDGLGDLDSDGYDDFIVGRKGSEYAKVYSGIDASILYDLAGTASSNFGDVVASIGDINGDYIDDFAVSAPIARKVSVYSGNDGAVLFNWSGDAYSYGSALSPAGDVNNDGVPDVLIGSADDDLGGTLSYAGIVEVRSGSDGSIIHTISGSNANGHLGSAVSDIGDINADGYDDFALKRYSSSSNYVVVSIYSGQSGSILRTISGYYGSAFGRCLENMGDIDHDGVNDLGVGHPEGSTANNGYVQIWSGSRLDDVLVSITGEAYSKSGYTVANVGDFNGDGTNDFLMSLHLGGSGKAWLVSGSDKTILFEFLPGAADTGYGYGLALAGDVNGDGNDDFIIGASGSGRVEVVSILLDSDSDGVADQYDAYPLDETMQ